MARTNTSIRLSADEKRRLLEWGPDLASAVRRVLRLAEMCALPSYAPIAPTTRDHVRSGLAAGHSVAELARELGVTRQAVQWHMKRIREGA
jgi:hypothetical protein